ncbi:preprotein translocase subunit SecE [Candidatus Hepatobacter penaei]|uniref:preprotein translocase subunit SecE n=1 Tax=Candidatus Hepatobacter penaei TaxID=1274402 RepID=UPI0004F2F5F8|nr:preprotein translocase subunit SecE [Candidatus Hepatobacter penaei]TGW15352.1 preprotein translocase subunit SecE [bacterium NHP-B]
MTTEKAKTSWLTFVRQVRLEASRVMWPSRQEVVTTTIFVFIMVALFSLFFLAVDSLVSSAVQWLIR